MAMEKKEQKKMSDCLARTCMQNVSREVELKTSYFPSWRQCFTIGSNK